jgi:hypothetical protein
VFDPKSLASAFAGVSIYPACLPKTSSQTLKQEKPEKKSESKLRNRSSSTLGLHFDIFNITTLLSSSRLTIQRVFIQLPAFSTLLAPLRGPLSKPEG